MMKSFWMWMTRTLLSLSRLTARWSGQTPTATEQFSKLMMRHTFVPSVYQFPRIYTQGVSKEHQNSAGQTGGQVTGYVQAHYAPYAQPSQWLGQKISGSLTTAGQFPLTTANMPYLPPVLCTLDQTTT